MAGSAKQFLRAGCLALFVVYLGWNAYWLSRGAVPPSILHHLTGIPVPTTGMTRSFLALMRGDWLASLSFNPFTLPVIILIGITAGMVARRRSIPRGVELAWYITLACAWVYTLIRYLR